MVIPRYIIKELNNFPLLYPEEHNQLCKIGPQAEAVLSNKAILISFAKPAHPIIFPGGIVHQANRCWKRLKRLAT